MGVDRADWIWYVRKDGRREKKYRQFCNQCDADRGYKVIGARDQICQSCRTKNTFKRLEKSSDNIQNHSDGRRLYKHQCPSCLKDMGYRRLRESKRLCHSCAHPKTDPLIKELKKSIRSRLRDFLSKRRYSKTITKYLGCSIEELRAHLESRFQPGMTWDNRGFDGWHIDHIVPLDQAKCEADVYQLSHYSNLQPLWAKDNFKKGCKYDKQMDE